MYKPAGKFRKLMRRLANRWLDRLENNGNPDMERNGESAFLTSLVRRLPQDRSPVVFDIGGNMGDYSALLLAASSTLPIKPRIHVFEPASPCVDALTTKFKEQEHVTIVPCALSDSEGEATINFDRRGSGLASLHARDLEFYGLSLSEKETIRTMRADEYIRAEAISHIDFVKIDVEGHEVSVLRGFGEYLRPDFIDFIQFEYGGANLDSRTSLMELYRILNSSGFSVAKVMPHALEPRRYDPSMETFRYANFVASGPGPG